jgi:hypothetical protein
MPTDQSLEEFTRWYLRGDRLRGLADRAARLAPVATCECHRGQPDPHTPQGARAHRLRRAYEERMAAGPPKDSLPRHSDAQ